MGSTHSGPATLIINGNEIPIDSWQIYTKNDQVVSTAKFGDSMKTFIPGTFSTKIYVQASSLPWNHPLSDPMADIKRYTMKLAEQAMNPPMVIGSPETTVGLPEVLAPEVSYYAGLRSAMMTATRAQFTEQNNPSTYVREIRGSMWNGQDTWKLDRYLAEEYIAEATVDILKGEKKNIEREISDRVGNCFVNYLTKPENEAWPTYKYDGADMVWNSITLNPVTVNLAEAKAEAQVTGQTCWCGKDHEVGMHILAEEDGKYLITDKGIFKVADGLGKPVHKWTDYVSDSQTITPLGINDTVSDS